MPKVNKELRKRDFAIIFNSREMTNVDRFVILTALSSGKKSDSRSPRRFMRVCGNALTLARRFGAAALEQFEALRDDLGASADAAELDALRALLAEILPDRGPQPAGD